MLSTLFLSLSLAGAEWVLYLLVLLSIVSVALIFERAFFYRSASKDLTSFRARLRQMSKQGAFSEAIKIASERTETTQHAPDLEAEMALAILSNPHASYAIKNELAQDAVIRARLLWERNLSVLATIGNNAPFVGLFGTVLGIIKAFHDLAQQAGSGAQTVSSGISESLVATAIGLLVAIPAVVSYNYFQRRVKSSLGEAEALKCYLIAHAQLGEK
jgi:biopolymer transport protein ExbB/TolQ